jgi:hypothetical protein
VNKHRLIPTGGATHLRPAIGDPLDGNANKKERWGERSTLVSNISG